MNPPIRDWDRPPWNRWSFQHVGEVLPTAEVWRGDGPVRRLARQEQDLDALAVDGLDGAPATLATLLQDSFTDGFLVLHRGSVIHERYFNNMEPHTLHLSQSLAKSFTGGLAGILAGRGLIDVAAPIAEYVPELSTTAYRGASVQHLLDMTSGVRFTEDYADPFSDMGRADVASGWKPVPEGGDPASHWPQSMFELVLSLGERDAEHGRRFAYRSIETDVLAFALERASGRRLPQLLSEEIWQKLGMEQSASMTIDRAGFALADGGLNASLADYGRFGQMILENGGGIVPAAWIEATRRGGRQSFGSPYTEVLPEGAYRNQFWIENPRGDALLARGVFGQLIYINWEFNMVVVKLSSWPEFVNPRWTIATLAAVRRIGAALN